MMTDAGFSEPSRPALPESIPGPRGTTIAPVRLVDGTVSAVLHAPEDGTATRAGIICPPIFYEHQLCQRTLRVLAERLAATGAYVLRFDYRGTGDSIGDPEACGPSTWIEDAHAGIEFLTTLGHAPTFYLGLRAGATVAMACTAEVRAQASSPQPELLAWAPILDGRAYADELAGTHWSWFERYRRHHRARADPGSREQRVLGYAWPSVARSRLEELAAPGPGALTGPITLIETLGHSLADPDRAALTAAAPELTTLEVEGPAPWRQDPDSVSPTVPARALETIVSAFAAERVS